MPASRRSDDLTILIVAFVAMALLTVAAFVVAPADSSPRVIGSSFSTRSDGAKAAYLVLKQLGHAVERSYDPIAAIGAEPGATTLILASPAEEPSRQDVRALRSLVENGALLLAYGRSAAPFITDARRQDESELDDKTREFPHPSRHR